MGMARGNIDAGIRQRIVDIIAAHYNIKLSDDDVRTAEVIPKPKIFLARRSGAPIRHPEEQPSLKPVDVPTIVQAIKSDDINVIVEAIDNGVLDPNLTFDRMQIHNEYPVC